MKLRMRLLSLLLAGALAFTSVDMSVYAASLDVPGQEDTETRTADDNGNQTADGQPKEGEPEEGEPATEEGEATEENAESEADADAEAEPTEAEPTEEEPTEEELVEEELTEEELLTEEEEEEEEEQIISYNEITPIHTKYKLALVSLEKKFPKYIYAMTNKDEEVKIRIYDWVAVDDYDQNLGEYKFEPVIDTDYQVSEDAEEPALMVYVEDESDGAMGYVADENQPDVPVVKNESGLLKASLPDTYNNKDNLPVIRDQGQEGACWAFATMAAIESDLISKGEASKSIDLSELQLAYFAAHNFDDPKNCHDNDTFSFAGAPGKKYLSTGGNTTISTRALMNKIGAVKEDYAPYSMGGDAVLDDKFAVSSDYVQLYDSYEINYENKDLIKEAIMQRGAVAASFWAKEGNGFGHTVTTTKNGEVVGEKEYRGDAHYSATYNSFYGSYENTNHAIALVGWDDNFSKDNFYEGCKPEGNGAWLVRNSWGLDDYGKQGYFWLSYYDAGLKSSGSVTAFSASTTQYDNAYSYATGESVSYYTIGSYNDGEPITIEVKYSVDSGETIEAVSTEILNTNSKIDVSVTDGKNTVSGSRNVVEAGNYTVKLTSGLEITKKTDVTVTVTITPAANEKPLLLFEDTDPNEIGDPNPYSKDYCVTTHTASMDKGFSVKRGNSTTDYSKDPLVRIYTNDVTTGDVSGELSVSEDEILDYGGTTHTVTMADDSIIKDASKLTWSVVDNTIATVSAAGVITLGHKRGSTIVVGSYVDPTTKKKYDVNIRVTIKPYEIIYDGDGITVADKYKEYYPGDVASCALPTSTQIRKLGYKLEGLYLDAEFTTKLTSEILSTKTGTVTVYPKWEKQKVSLGYIEPNATLDGYINSRTIFKWDLYMEDFPYTLPKRSDLYSTNELIKKEGTTGKVFSYFSWDEAGEQPVSVVTLDDAFAADNELNSVYGLMVTLYPQYKEDTSVKVTFNPNGGSVNKSSQSVEPGEAYGTLPTPTRTGYTFTGWHLNTASGTKVESTTIVNTNSAHTLVASWEAKKYTITFSANGGTVDVATKEVTYDAAIGELPVPTKAHATFKGWYTSTTGGSVYTASTVYKNDGDKTLYAQWNNTPQRKVSFLSNGGSTCNSMMVYYGETYGVLPKPTRAGYDFEGWHLINIDGPVIHDNDEVTTNSNHSLQAGWKAKNYTITFNANGGTVDAAPMTVTFDSAIGTLPTPTRANYKFGGWYTGATGGNKYTSVIKYDIADNTTFYAHWTELNKVKITFNANGGDVTPSSKTVYEDDAYGDLPTPTRAGYEFVEWRYNSASGMKVTGETQLKSKINHTLYASWKANTYNVTFDPNGGTVSTTTKSFTSGSGIYDLPNPTREGYIFDGWFTEKSEGTKVKAGDIYNYAKDITLYAHWLEKPAVEVKVTVYIRDYRARVLDTREIKQGEPYGTLPEIPERSGYRPVGWYSSSKQALISETDIVGMYTEDYVTPRYEAIEYTAHVIFDSNGGSAVEPKTYKWTYDSVPQFGELEIPTKENAEFLGWSTVPTVEIFIVKDTDEILLKNSYDASQLESDITLYAMWKDKTDESAETDEKETDSDNDADSIENLDDRAEYKASPKTGLWLAGIHNRTYTYNGAAFKLAPDADFRVYDGTVLLQNKVDYTYKLAKNTNAGEATLSITGKGDYTGTYTDTFTIAPKPFDADTTFTLGKDAYPYTGKLVSAAVTVKDVRNGKTVTLAKNKDYTLEYFDAANGQATTNAMTPASGQKAVKITGKGNYTGETTLFYYVANKAECLSNAAVTVDSKAVGIGQGTDDQASNIKLTVKLNGKKLEDETLAKCTITYKYVDIPDSVEYSNRSKIVTGGNYMVTITANNEELFGSVSKKFAVKGGTALSNKMISGFVAKVPYTAATYTQPYATAGLTEGVDYILVRDTSANIGKHTDTFYGIGKYKGKLAYTYTIAGTPISKNATVTVTNKNTGKDFFEFKGEPYTLDDLVVKVTVDSKEVSAENYDIQLPKDTLNAGAKDIVIVGKNLYTGKLTKKKAFTISTVNLDESANRARIKVTVDDKIKFIKGGVKKLPTITFDGKVLSQDVVKTSFAITYSNNTGRIAKAEDDRVKVTIKPKKNFAGKLALDPIYYTIINKDLKDVTITAADKVYNVNMNNVKSAPVLNDIDDNGKLKKLVAGTDYEKTITYRYAKIEIGAPITQKVGKNYQEVQRKDGDEVVKGDVIPVGTVIEGTVTGKGAYSGPITFTYRIVSANLSSATVTVKAGSSLKNGLDYTGKAMYISQSDLVVKIGKHTLTEDEYEIVDYQNNVKKGNATITLKGKGSYGGTKNFKFKINAKSIAKKAN